VAARPRRLAAHVLAFRLQHSAIGPTRTPATLRNPGGQATDSKFPWAEIWMDLRVYGLT
jgi:hypothetical protein